MTGEPCAAPCWHGVLPGVSTEDDVWVALEGNPYVAQESIRRTLETHVQIDAEYVVFNWRSMSGGENWIHLSDGVVLDVLIAVEYGLTLGEVVEEFGAPEYVYGFIDGVESFNYLVWLYYPGLGASFHSATINIDVDDYLVPDTPGMGILSDSLKVTEVMYFAPNSLEGYMKDVLASMPEMIDYLVANTHEWDGFGTIELAPGL